MLDKLLLLRNNEFLKDNAVFFVGTLMVSVINYLYYPVLGRLLETTQFGELQVLVSLVTQAAILMQVFGLVATNIVVNEKDTAKTNAILSELQKISLWIGGVVVAGIVLAAPLLQQSLKFESAWPFIVVGLVFLATIPATFTNAYLRAKKDFKAASVTQAIGAISKLILSAILVYLGFKAFGAITGLLLAQIITVFYTGYRARKLGYTFVKSGKKIQMTLLKPHLKFAGFVLITSLITTSMVTIDSIAVKYFLSPTEAGLYGGISTIARIIFFLTGSVGMVLLSSVKIEQTPSKNIALLKRSVLLTVALGGSALLFFTLFPTFVIHVLMGSRYDEYAGYLPLLSAAIMAISVGNLLSQYHIALRHYFVAVPVALGAIVTAIAILINHGSIQAIITSLAIGSFVLLFSLAAWTAYRGRSVLVRSH